MSNHEDFWAEQQLAKNNLQMAVRIIQLEKIVMAGSGNPIRKKALIEKLKAAEAMSQNDAETAHGNADELLLQFINDDEIRAAYDAVVRWYA